MIDQSQKPSARDLGCPAWAGTLAKTLNPFKQPSSRNIAGFLGSFCRKMVEPSKAMKLGLKFGIWFWYIPNRLAWRFDNMTSQKKFADLHLCTARWDANGTGFGLRGEAVRGTGIFAAPNRPSISDTSAHCPNLPFGYTLIWLGELGHKKPVHSPNFSPDIREQT